MLAFFGFLYMFVLSAGTGSAILDISRPSNHPQKIEARKKRWLRNHRMKDWDKCPYK